LRIALFFKLLLLLAWVRVRMDADETKPFYRIAEVLDIYQFRGLHHVGIRTYDNRQHTP